VASRCKITACGSSIIGKGPAVSACAVEESRATNAAIGKAALVCAGSAKEAHSSAAGGGEHGRTSGHRTVRKPAPIVEVALIAKFCVIPELFVIPMPLMVREKNPGPTSNVKRLAPVLKAMPFTSVLAESETLVVFETPKVPVSEAPLGTVAGVQLAAVFKSPLIGLRFHLALPPWLE